MHYHCRTGPTAAQYPGWAPPADAVAVMSRWGRCPCTILGLPAVFLDLNFRDASRPVTGVTKRGASRPSPQRRVTPQSTTLAQAPLAIGAGSAETLRRTTPTQGGRMAAFVQVIEFTTTRIDEVRKLGIRRGSRRRRTGSPGNVRRRPRPTQHLPQHHRVRFARIGDGELHARDGFLRCADGRPVRWASHLLQPGCPRCMARSRLVEDVACSSTLRRVAQAHGEPVGN